MVRDLKVNYICVNFIAKCAEFAGYGGESGEFHLIRWNFTAFPATGQASET